jgi:LysM repeat protein
VAAGGAPRPKNSLGRYSARVSESPRRDPFRALLPWVAATAIVLALAVTAGFVTAYLVASGRAVDAPVAAASPTPRPTAAPPQATATAQATSEPGSTNQPRRTPTPPVEITPEPSPFEHTISRGESLSYIAGLYCTTVREIQELNGIENPNRIQIDQVILIPGRGCESPAP